MIFSVEYAESVRDEDIPKLSAVNRRRIRAAIEEKLTVHPEVFGKPLRRSLKGYRSLRVGDFRVIFRILADEGIVRVFVIQHRSVAYRQLTR